MSPSKLSVHEQQTLAVLSVTDLVAEGNPPEKQMLIRNVQEHLAYNHFDINREQCLTLLMALQGEGLVKLFEADDTSLRIAITREGRLRLRDLIESDSTPVPIFEITERWLDKHYPNLGKSVVAAESEPAVVMLCLTEGALNAWWGSLSHETKGEVHTEWLEAMAIVMSAPPEAL